MPSASEPATFVLIHGGASSSWDWHLVDPVLRELGHDVIAVDLPFEDAGNGIGELADAVVAASAGRPRPVVVAHSFGGLVAPVVCSRMDAELLVLLAAMIPKPAETANEWWGATRYHELGISFSTREDELEVFYNGVPAPLVEASYEHEREHNGGWDTPSPLAAWPSVPTRYLLCREDHCFPPEFTRAHVAERLGIVPDEIDGGHMVALSHPRALAERLHRFWTEQQAANTK
ncbi:alpha/beta hydrolase [Glycomyces sp. NPDC049804]|uniref:alpha/beta fold hydrolase n=1 Tax=Glycomyces sp. NPDC049804 TaxID=3154363 RepID=UPI0034456EB3